MQLRSYQQKAVDSIMEYFSSEDGNPLVSMATGLGKSVVIADFARMAVTSWPSTRILVLAPNKELVEQNHAKMKAIWPDAPTGILCAGLKRKDIFSQILFATINSIKNKAMEIGKVDLIIVDEAHLIPVRSESMYRTFFDSVRIHSPNFKVIGFTATPWRLGQGSLLDGDNAIFSKVVYNYDLVDGIADGWLCPPRSIKAKNQIDLTNVASARGDFVMRHMEESADTAELNSAAVDEIIRQGETRRSWIVFCSGASHAHHITDLLNANGVSAQCILGDTPDKQRNDAIGAHKSGKLKCIVNVGVCTTGFDSPSTDLVVLLRATQSPVLLVQMIGRGTRLADGKNDCAVLDFGQNIDRHGALDRIRVDPPKPKDDIELAEGEDEKDSPEKICPLCNEINALSARNCVGCGHRFVDYEKQYDEKVESTGAAALSTQEPTTWLQVYGVQYDKHIKKDTGSCTMRVDYRGQSGKVTSEWVCIEHSGFAGEKARKWWHERSDDPFPESVDKALQLASDLKWPAQIQTVKDGKYTRILSYSFDTLF